MSIFAVSGYLSNFLSGGFEAGVIWTLGIFATIFGIIASFFSGKLYEAFYAPAVFLTVVFLFINSNILGDPVKLPKQAIAVNDAVVVTTVQPDIPWHMFDNVYVGFGLLFWVVLLTEIGVLGWFVKKDNGAAALATMLVSIGLAQLLSGYPIFQTMYHYWIYSIAGFISYLLIGVLVTYIKWDLFQSDHSKRYLICRREFCNQRSILIDPVTQDPQWKFDTQNPPVSRHKNEWLHLRDGIGISDDDGPIYYRPTVKRFFNKLLTWLIAWPLVLIKDFLSEWIINLFHNIIKLMTSKLNQIMERRWAGINE